MGIKISRSQQWEGCGLGRQNNIEVMAAPFAFTGFGGKTSKVGEIISRVTVDGNRRDLIIFIKKFLCAVTVVKVDI